MGAVAWQAVPNPPRSAYSIHGHSGSTIAIPAPTVYWNVHQPATSGLPVIQEKLTIADDRDRPHAASFFVDLA